MAIFTPPPNDTPASSERCKTLGVDEWNEGRSIKKEPAPNAIRTHDANPDGQKQTQC